MNENEIARLSKECIYCDNGDYTSTVHGLEWDPEKDRSIVVHDPNNPPQPKYRYDVAGNEYQRPAVSDEQLKQHVKNFGTQTDIRLDVSIDSIDPYGKNEIYNASSIIWCPFDTLGHIVLVGYGSLDFKTPASEREYDKKDRLSGKWEWHSPGILLHYVGGKYDNTKVLAVRLLVDIPQKYKNIYGRPQTIKRALGNHLIECGVTIIYQCNHKIKSHAEP